MTDTAMHDLFRADLALALLLVATAAACVASGDAAPSPPASQPHSQPSSQPASRPAGPAADPAPAGATGTREALELAGRVVEFAGGLVGWRAVDTITLEFNGWRRLFWDVRGGKVRVESLRDDDDWRVLVHDIHADRVLLRHPAAGANAPARSAKGLWINDFYWLLAPLKVLDDGVVLAIDPPADGDAAGIARLRLRFDGVGLTPQNEYVLHVDADTGEVRRWDFHRTADAAPLSWRFTGYRRIGPLHVSTERPAVSAPRDIVLRWVHVDVPVPDGAWTATEPLLR